MPMDTTVTIDHIPETAAETTRAREILTRLAEAFEIPDAEVRVWAEADGQNGEIRLAAYAHTYQIDGIHPLARILSRLFAPHKVRVEEEGEHDDYWGRASTYQQGRLTCAGTKQWVEHPVTE
ncbi:hypothetical protein [Microbacterium sp. JB110]|uniref:hypothetical protein n=1 Tax=Microbacterium sp. JB110 TaxID=2024477 RepID=UPI001123D51B|nr:hypothetical protein [Microbacterium sp. JB110]